MGSLDEFQSRLARKAAGLVAKIDSSDLADGIARGLRGEVLEPLPEMSSDDRWWLELATTVGEVTAALEALNHVPLYLRFVPQYKTWRRGGITDASYLRYHVEHFFQEVYALSERVDHLLDFLIASATREGRQAHAGEVTQTKRRFAKVTKPLRPIRGGYVHRRGFADEVIDALKLIDLVEGSGAGSPINEETRQAILQSGFRYWRSRIRELAAIVALLLDQVFEGLGPIVFEDWAR
jgi:hypothetical protein